MGKCPKCGKEVNELEVHRHHRQVEVWRAFLNGDGEIDYDCIKTESWDEWTEEKYICPACGATLFETKEEAEDFLKSKAKQTPR